MISVCKVGLSMITMMTSSNGNIFRVTGILWIHRSPENSPHKGQWRGALMLSLICAWINGWVNNNEAGDLRRHRAHYDVIVTNSSGKPFKWFSFPYKIFGHRATHSIKSELRIHTGRFYGFGWFRMLSGWRQRSIFLVQMHVAYIFDRHTKTCRRTF